MSIQQKALWILVASCALSVGCSTSNAPATSPDARVVVFAASSLAGAFDDLESEFERAHPGVDVVIQYAGSQILRLQIEQGAHADVFASANEQHARALVEEGLGSHLTAFAMNELVVIAADAEASPLRSFADLARSERIVLGSVEVPAGRYAESVLDRAAAHPDYGAEFVRSVRSHVVSRESNVRLVRAKVELGEATAAMVYRTDAEGISKIYVIDIPNEFQPEMIYFAVDTAGARRHARSAEFISFLLTDSGRAILRRHGFKSVAQ